MPDSRARGRGRDAGAGPAARSERITVGVDSKEEGTGIAPFPGEDIIRELYYGFRSLD